MVGYKFSFELILVIFLWFMCIENGSSFRGRIVNGTEAQSGEYPYVVSIRYNGDHECGGSIIGDRWILTAAHCIFKNYINVSTILYGTVLIQNGESPPEFTKLVKRAIVNEHYENVGGYFNDIGLMEIEGTFVFGGSVQPIQLPSNLDSVPRYRDSILVGWGYNGTANEVMPILQEVDITVFSDETCKGYFKDLYSSVSHICAGVEGGGKGQCTGDSGGPLTIDGVQHGIVSWSAKPCTITPGVLTRVASFRSWILSNTGI